MLTAVLGKSGQDGKGVSQIIGPQRALLRFLEQRSGVDEFEQLHPVPVLRLFLLRRQVQVQVHGGGVPVRRRPVPPHHEVLADDRPGLGFMAVVDFATSDFETCPKYQNWANFINKSTTES